MARAKVSEAKKATAIAKLTEQTEVADAAEENATRQRHKKFSYMLRAFDGGLTYDEIAAITGLSKIRVSQVLAEQRDMKAPEPPKAPARKAPAKKTVARKAPAKKAPARKRAA